MSKEALQKIIQKIDAAGGPAFPVSVKLGYGSSLDFHGMTLRDYFAGQAMLGLISTPGREIAGSAYRIADAMLEERKK